MSDVQPAAASAQNRPYVRLTRMQKADLDEVVRIENAIYPFPWTRGNFIDSIDSGYETWIMRDGSGALAGYFLLMQAVDEAHLLNITVGAEFQHRGLGRVLLDKVVELARAKGMRSVLLEVRPSNQHALSVYRHCGFSQIGVRRNYYPAPQDKREDAIVMRVPL
jgi:ribosomal-protein-alanine N-acetyltransferase